MNVPVEPAPFDKLPFIQVKEYVDPDSGVFIAIGKVQVIHMAISSKLDGIEAALKIVQMCTRTDERPFTEKELWNMDSRLFNKLLEMITQK